MNSNVQARFDPGLVYLLSGVPDRLIELPSSIVGRAGGSGLTVPLADVALADGSVLARRRGASAGEGKGSATARGAQDVAAGRRGHGCSERDVADGESGGDARPAARADVAVRGDRSECPTVVATAARRSGDRVVSPTDRECRRPAVRAGRMPPGLARSSRASPNRTSPGRGLLRRAFLHGCCALASLPLHAGFAPDIGDAAAAASGSRVVAVSRTPSATPAEPRADDVQGLQISIRELERVRELARRGIQPYRNDVDTLVDIADEGWTHGTVGVRFEGRIVGEGVYDKLCVRTPDPAAESVLPDAGENLYALVLAHVLTRRETYAREARAVLLDFADSSGFDKVDGEVSYTGANRCALDLSLLTPQLIDSALLLEAWSGWGTADRDRLHAWLATEVYPVTSAIARTRKNNWGTAAAFASWSIGLYLSGTNRVLEEVYPVPLTLTPEEARAGHLESQLEIIGNDWRGDSRCERFGIQPHGGFPNELRRGSTGCTGDHLLDDDSSYSYQIMTTSHLIYHAEALRRHGGDELYTYGSDEGEPMLLRAITFVTDNPRGRSHDWKSTEIGVLRVANQVYDDERLCEQIEKGFRFVEGRYLPFARLTRPDTC